MDTKVTKVMPQNIVKYTNLWKAVPSRTLIAKIDKIASYKRVHSSETIQ